MMQKNQSPILEVENLVKHFPVKKSHPFQRHRDYVHAVNGVTFKIYPGETLGIVGESGCGKSTTARTIIRLEEATSGKILFMGKDLSKLKGEELRNTRKDIQMIFQDPYASLNPKMKVGEVLAEPLMEHGICTDKEEIEKRVKEMMELVKLEPSFVNRYPHEFSGGQRQRIGIARALILEPKLIICDEPISALDVSVQAQVVNLLEDLQKSLGIAYLFVAHDLSMIKHISDRVGVMYAGELVEIGEKNDIYENPSHPYAQALLSVVPIPDPKVERNRKRILLKGEVPSIIHPPKGCSFCSRCRYASEKCKTEKPALREISPGHLVACHGFEEI